MTTLLKGDVEDAKNGSVVVRGKSRDNAKDTLCRNVTIYGKCRYEDRGCAFSHDMGKPLTTAVGAPTTNGSPSDSSALKKALNVDSPSFTPSFLSPTDASNGAKKSVSISPKMASAAPFMPKAVTSRNLTATPPVRQDARTPDWAMIEAREFVPRRLEPSVASEADVPPNHAFETFQTTPQPNPYLDSGINSAAFFQSSATFQQPVQYHQYAPIGPYNSNMLPYQRNVHDLFISNELREELQKKAAATLQILPNSQLPSHIESYHSLVPLDTTHQKGSTIFGGYTSWIYKAQSSQNGHFFALRRVEGFRLTSELAIRTVQTWKHIVGANIVRIIDAFTNRSFGDSSLILVTDYHPLSKTLAEHHHIGGQGRQYRGRGSIDQVPEAVLWSYVVQIASALKTIHSNGLAARVIDPTKIIVTGKNRIRLNGCAVLDVIQYDSKTPLAQLQRQDLVNFGLVILSVGANTADAAQNFARAMDQLKRYYKPDLQNAVIWLYSAMQNQDKTIDQFVTLIAPQMITAFNAALHLDDSIHSDLSGEVENGRLFRLMAKLNFINERPEFEHDRQWSENGERYFLKLFRDYVFHQVDAQNHPHVDLAHVLSCLNKLDAGTDERITLLSRNEDSCFIVSYRELKKGIESAFQDLTKHERRLH